MFGVKCDWNCKNGSSIHSARNCCTIAFETVCVHGNEAVGKFRKKNLSLKLVWFKKCNCLHSAAGNICFSLTSVANHVQTAAV